MGSTHPLARADGAREGMERGEAEVVCERRRHLLVPRTTLQGTKFIENARQHPPRHRPNRCPPDKNQRHPLLTPRRVRRERELARAELRPRQEALARSLLLRWPRRKRRQYEPGDARAPKIAATPVLAANSERGGWVAVRHHLLQGVSLVEAIVAVEGAGIEVESARG